MSAKRLLATLILILAIAAGVCADEGPLILITNDDGIGSEGIRALAVEMAKLGEVVVVAPLNNSSGVGHGITYRVPISYGQSENFEGIEAWWVDALPATCVRWGIDTRFAGRLPDLIVSGINDGTNLGEAVYYSGTVGAAREGALCGVPSIAVSMDRGELMDYSGAAVRIRKIAGALLSMDDKPLLLNVNIPAGRIDESTELRVTKLSDIRWRVDYHDRESPRGGRYFWITYAGDHPPEAGSDAEALALGAITVTPLKLKVVDPEEVESLREALNR